MLRTARLMTSSASTSSANVPPAVRNWLKSQYRDAPIKETWLVETVRNGSKESNGNSPTALVQYVKHALLNTSLANSLEKGTLPAGISKSKQTVLGGPTLLEIVGKLDIGISAQTQLDVLEARRQARLTIGGLSEEAHLNADVPVAKEQEQEEDTDHMAEFNATEEAASLPATVFPRSTLQLKLSDGFTTITAIEHKKISSLSMTDPPMGAKIVLRGAKVKQGYILLSPDVVEIKGGKVDDLENTWESRLIDELRAKLGKEPLRDKSQAQSGTIANTVQQQQRPTPPSSILSALNAHDEDEEAEAAALFEQLHRRSDTLKRPNTPSTKSAGASKQLKLPPKTTTVKSPYFANKHVEGHGSANKSGEQAGEEEEEEFQMLDMNDLENPIVLSDSD
ncbi:unnamed protein product [Sympodiomycopsis kandeliae]